MGNEWSARNRERMRELKREFKERQKEKALLKKRFPHLYICGKCAKTRKGTWDTKNISTVIHKKCPYCDGKNQVAVIAAPWTSYIFPNPILE